MSLRIAITTLLFSLTPLGAAQSGEVTAMLEPGHGTGGIAQDGGLVEGFAWNSSAFLRGRSRRTVVDERAREVLDRIVDDLEPLGRSVPTILPVLDPRITSGLGLRRNPVTRRRRPHHGVDLAVPIGTPVVAPADGVVIEVAWHRGYGRVIVVDHGHGFVTRYAHLHRFEVEVGQAVRRGKELGLSGNSGRTTGPHLHYECWYQGKAVDPTRALVAPWVYGRDSAPLAKGKLSSTRSSTIASRTGS